MYILSFNEMSGGIPLHTESELHETRERAIGRMKSNIDLYVRNLLGIKAHQDWDFEKAKKHGFEVDYDINGGKVVNINKPLENYIYYYIDEVEM